MSQLRNALLCLTVIVGFVAPVAAWAGATEVPEVVPYSEEGLVPGNVVAECTRLGTQLGTFIKQFADANGTDVVLSSNIDYASAPSALRIEIVNVVSAGNAFTGHSKAMSVKVELLKAGEVTAKTTLSRNSMGGVFGGYKGSCAVLGRVTKALGKDVAAWLRDQ